MAVCNPNFRLNHEMEPYNPNSFFAGTAIVLAVALIVYSNKPDKPKKTKDLKGAYPEPSSEYAHAATDFVEEALNGLTSVFACKDKMDVKDRDEFIKSQHDD